MDDLSFSSSFGNDNKTLGDSGEEYNLYFTPLSEDFYQYTSNKEKIILSMTINEIRNVTGSTLFLQDESGNFYLLSHLAGTSKGTEITLFNLIDKTELHIYIDSYAVEASESYIKFNNSLYTPYQLAESLTSDSKFYGSYYILPDKVYDEGFSGLDTLDFPNFKELSFLGSDGTLYYIAKVEEDMTSEHGIIRITLISVKTGKIERIDYRDCEEFSSGRVGSYQLVQSRFKQIFL